MLDGPDLTDLSMNGANHLHPFGLRSGLQQRGTDAVFNSFFHIFWTAVGTVLDVQVLCSQLNMIIFLR